NEAYSRFVPKQFLDILGKESYTDVQLGDQVEKEMTILFADIRNFTDLSESMTPVENFNFLNRYLGYMEPVIRRNNGFIDKYIGDSIMALFETSVEDALNAAIEMRIKLTEFNQVITQFGMEPIDIGIGMHTGNLMLGVVGGEGRMDGTVISDAVNLAARLEGLNKTYGASIIISEDLLVKIDDASIYDYRFLDIVKVKGKKKAVYIFELLNGDSDDCRYLKMETKALFGMAIDEYRNKEFESALKNFSALLDKNPMDHAALMYLKRCKEAIKHGVPDDWDGVETFLFKS
ncbi:MAG: adenylate/guanylate cyclase domain-containing protein, partial [Bacteroidales bacterium]|nr:adenylate/guanylate cyclase domain-containing protein [Bacteroidales bacterium]